MHAGSQKRNGQDSVQAGRGRQGVHQVCMPLCYPLHVMQNQFTQSLRKLLYGMSEEAVKPVLHRLHDLAWQVAVTCYATNTLHSWIVHQLCWHVHNSAALYGKGVLGMCCSMGM